MGEKFGNVKIRTKFLSAFLLLSFIGLVLGITGLLAINTLTRMLSDLNKLQRDSATVEEVLKFQYKWGQDLTETILSGSPFTGSLDPRNCLVGKWLESDSVRSITNEKIKSLLNKIPEPHDYVHYEGERIIRFLNAGDADSAKDHFIKGSSPDNTMLFQTWIRLRNSTMKWLI